MTVSDILARAADGERIEVDEAVLLDEQADSAALQEVAQWLRRQKSDPETVTYLVDRNVNYTNVCVTDCKFCEFYRPVGHEESYVLTRDRLFKKIQETLDVGGTRILLQGGHNPDLGLAWYEDLLTAIKGEFPSIELNAFSPSEIEHIANRDSLSMREVLAALKAAGMDGLPGGGGEILHDDIRHRVSPKKQKTEGWLEAMRIAQDLDMVTSASQVIGFGEKPWHRFESMRRLRELTDESMSKGRLGFLSFVFWPLQYESRYGHIFGAKKGQKLGATTEEYLRHTALSRIVLDNIPHLGASWPTMGPEIAKQALEWGADDFGSTMLEENVVSSAGSTHTSMTEEKIRRFIEEAGYHPQKRDSNYRYLETSV